MGTRTVLPAGAGSLAEYYDWLQEARAGDILVYWIGDLQYDRQVSVDIDDPDAGTKVVRINCANSVANRVLADCDAGLILLVQKRLDPYLTEYWAVRKSQPGGGGIRLQKVKNPDAELVFA